MINKLILKSNKSRKNNKFVENAQNQKTKS